MAVGTLLVPLSAVAAVYLSIPEEPLEEQPAESGLSLDSTSPPVEASVTSSLDSDIEAACGEAGLSLVELERAGTISGFQQTALDALRPICVQANLALPDGLTAPDAGPVVVEAVVEPAPLTVVETIDDDRDHEDPGDDDDDDRDDDDDDDRGDDDDDRDDD